MNKFSSFLIGFSTMAFLATPMSVLAGGGLISMDAYPNSGAQNYNVAIGEQFIVRPTVKTYEGTPCRNCPIKIKLENPQSNDLINQSSDKTDQGGTMYAKVISYISGPRLVYAEATLPNGEIYTGSPYLLNYVSNGQNITSNTSQTVTAPTGNTTVSTSQTMSGTNGTINIHQEVSYPATQSGQMEQMPQVQTEATLEAKVANLENQLAEANKRQSALEQRFNDLLRWVKSFFSFSSH